MTDDEIMEMAVKCYLISTGNREGFYGDALIQFAKLVAEAERERIIAANAPEIERCNAHIKMLEDELAAIRARGNT